MKRIIWSLCMGFALIIFASCNGNNASSSDKEVQPLELPELVEGEQIAFENDTLRIVDGNYIQTEDDDYNTIKVQPKLSGVDIKAFEVKGEFFSFEALVGNALIVSEGTGSVRILSVYDLSTGEPIFERDPAMTSDLEVIVVNDHQFYFYSYREAHPQVCWDEAKASWIHKTEVPAALLNDDLEKAKQENMHALFGGMTLMAHQKVLVDVRKRSISPLEEYKWNYIE